MRDSRTLHAWQRSHRLVIEVYRATHAYPAQERFGLIAQTRRAAASIPANVSEGSGRGSRRDYARFVRYAVGSASELEYHLLLARDLGYLDRSAHEHIDSELGQIRAMLVGLSRRLASAD